jgi:hypothetical protein
MRIPLSPLCGGQDRHTEAQPASADMASQGVSMTVRSCIIGFGAAVILWLVVTTANVGVSASQAVSQALGGS